MRATIYMFTCDAECDKKISYGLDKTPKGWWESIDVLFDTASTKQAQHHVCSDQCLLKYVKDNPKESAVRSWRKNS